MCDRQDIGISIGSGNEGDSPVLTRTGEPVTLSDEPRIFIYDNYPGGIGFSEPLFAMDDELRRRTRELIAGCECQHGVQTCVGPIGNTGPLAKTVALRILDLIGCGAFRSCRRELDRRSSARDRAAGRVNRLRAEGASASLAEAQEHTARAQSEEQDPPYGDPAEILDGEWRTGRDASFPGRGTQLRSRPSSWIDFRCRQPAARGRLVAACSACRNAVRRQPPLRRISRRRALPAAPAAMRSSSDAVGSVAAAFMSASSCFRALRPSARCSKR